MNWQSPDACGETRLETGMAGQRPRLALEQVCFGSKICLFPTVLGAQVHPCRRCLVLRVRMKASSKIRLMMRSKASGRQQTYLCISPDPL
jgi:hypothetical protein